MKLSLSWIFDHITGSWKDHDIPALIKRFNTTTAEIEYFDFWSFNVDHFTLVTITKSNDKTATAYSSEWDQELELPSRPTLCEGDIFLVKKEGSTYRWATGHDFNTGKEIGLPSLWVKEHQLKGGWKAAFEKEDYILTISNTSITHRPDLWSHRGVAREIAHMIEAELKPEDHFLRKQPVHISKTMHTQAGPFSLEVATPLCNRFAALSLRSVTYYPSLLEIASRLLRVESKPINALVDATNYVMFDIGQPMHAFDADKITSKELVITQASKGQEVTLLDGQKITLEPINVVISDGTNPLALAGIMGGLLTGVDKTTQSLLIEAGNFDPLSIRTSGQHFKLRTEASTRFEKSVDPALPPKALMRYLNLLEKHGMGYALDGEVQLVEQSNLPEHSLQLSYELIERTLGVTLDTTFITRTLSALGFEVGIYKQEPLIYTVKVPSFRMKDVLIAQDLIEEIGRWFGFDAIPHKLPCLTLKPEPLPSFIQCLEIKEFFAYAGRMREINNYAFFDEDFLKTIAWAPDHTLQLKNPVSEQMKRLATSLIPNLFKNIVSNYIQEPQLNFFELNNVWVVNGTHKQFEEKKNASGIFFDAKKNIDFYNKKAILEELFGMLGRDIIWQKPLEQSLPVWYHPFKTALLTHKDALIGYAGSVNPYFMQKFLPGDAFVFELDLDHLLAIPEKEKLFTSLARYQDTYRDISMLAPLKITVDELKNLILKTNSSFYNVMLIDFFQKEEWIDKRSITLRVYARDPYKTLSTQEINEIYNQLLHALTSLEIEIR